MLIIQHNCAKSYPISIAAIETGLKLNAAFICLQEPYIGQYSFSHPGYDFRWPEKGENREKRVLIAIKKDLLTKIIVENRTDLVNHPYFLALDIWELQKKRKIRRTRLINCYDNRIGPNTTYQGEIASNRRAIEDVNWDNLVQGRAILAGDFNAHSPLWNPLISISERKNANCLEAIINKFDLILNNEPGQITRPNSRENNSIIDLTFSTTNLGLLNSWLIEEEYTTPSDHELIVFEWEDLNQNREKRANPTLEENITGWDIDKLQQNEKQLQKAFNFWQEQTKNRPLIDEFSTTEDIENEAIWIEKTLKNTLNLHAKSLQITAYSKRWWNSSIKEARMAYSSAKRQLKNCHIEGLKPNLKNKLRNNRNNLYYTIRKEKRECWQRFLQGSTETLEDNIAIEDKNRCWTALKYTSSRATSTTPAITGPNGIIATSIEEKEAVFLESAYPKPLNSSNIDVNLISNSDLNAQKSFITEKDIEYALFGQSIKKAPGPDRFNFKSLRLLWSWDKNRIIALILQCFNLGFHPKNWKKAKGIILRKLNKSDYSIAKSYRIISLLNCLGKVAEKVAAAAIANFCEQNELLHEGQFGCRKQRSAIDAVAKLIHTTEQNWAKKQQLGALFMDVKGAFDYVVKNRLIQRMIELKIPNFLINWTNSFLTNRQAQLVIDGFTCPLRDIESGVPQGSPVSPILFIIYLSGLFNKIENEIPEITALSFADDIAFLAPGKTVKDITDILTKAGQETIAWGLLNNVSFDVNKTELVLFTKSRKIKQNIRNYSMILQNNTIKFNREATRWLGIWLDSGLTLKEHYQIRIQKAQKAEKRLKSISGTYGLASGLVRRVQIAAVQSVALYGAELWWKGQKDAINKLQKLINSQSRAIIGALPSSPIDNLIREANMTPAEPLLNYKQRNYALRGLKLPSNNPANQLLPPTFKYGDGSAQPNEFSEFNLQWINYRAKTRNIAQKLAKNLSFNLFLDPSTGFEEAKIVKKRIFPGEIAIFEREKAEIEAQRTYKGLNIWTDGSRADSGHIGAGITWKIDSIERQKCVALGNQKEIFDAELFGLLEAFKIAVKEEEKRSFKLLTIFSDSQTAIKRISNDELGPGQAIAIEIIAMAEKLRKNGVKIQIIWVPSHSNIEGNEKADLLAKKAAKQQKSAQIDGYTSFAHANRLIKSAKKQETQSWLFNSQKNRLKRFKSYKSDEQINSKIAINKEIFQRPKYLTNRFFQLKIGHAITASYLRKIKKAEYANCWWCPNRNQTINHLLFECEFWRKERQIFYNELAQLGLARPRKSDQKEKDKLFENPKAYKAILAFLESTKIGLKPNFEEIEREELNRLDYWGLEELYNSSSIEGVG